jgi:selenocysteine-specific elongation factor
MPGHDARRELCAALAQVGARVLLVDLDQQASATRNLGLDPEIVHLKLREGELVRVSENLVYLPEQISDLTGLMAGLGDGFTVADFRDAARLSRKYAVPILEWSDKEGLTVRRGDVRRFR